MAESKTVFVEAPPRRANGRGLDTRSVVLMQVEPSSFAPESAYATWSAPTVLEWDEVAA